MIYWIIKGKDGYFQIDTLSHYRKDSIAKFKKEGSFTWRQLKKFGWSCVKVKLEEVVK